MKAAVPTSTENFQEHGSAQGLLTKNPHKRKDDSCQGTLEVLFSTRVPAIEANLFPIKGISLTSMSTTAPAVPAIFPGEKHQLSNCHPTLHLALQCVHNDYAQCRQEQRQRSSTIKHNYLLYRSQSRDPAHFLRDWNLCSRDTEYRFQAHFYRTRSNCVDFCQNYDFFQQKHYILTAH